MTLLVGFVGFVGGAIAGSAATALADRYEQPRTFLVGRSCCPHCHTTLRWFELIPLVSWLVQRGRCRHCQWPIGWEVLAVELTGAVVGALAAGQIGFGWALFWLGCSLIGLGALALVDLETQLLPDRLILATLPALLATGLTNPAAHVTFGSAVLGGLVGGGSLFLIWLVTRGRGIGLGDAKLMGAVGLALGWPLTVVALWWASILGGLVAGWLLLTGRAKLGGGTAVAFGPLLILGYLLAFLTGHGLLAWFGLV